MASPAHPRSSRSSLSVDSQQLSPKINTALIGLGGTSNEQTFTTTSRPPSLSTSRPSSSRGSSRPATPKWVPPALEQKLQHYRDNPDALQQLNQRVKQLSRPSSPRKTPTGSTAAARPLAPWASSQPAAHSQGSSAASTAPPSPSSCRVSRQKAALTADGLMLATHEPCCRAASRAEGADTQQDSCSCSSSTSAQPCPPAACAGQQPQHNQPHLQDTEQAGLGTLSQQHQQELQQEHREEQHQQHTWLDPARGQQHQQHHLQTVLEQLPLGQQQQEAAGACQCTSAAGCDAALQLQQLLEQQEQEHEQQYQLQLQQKRQDEVWQQIERARLDRHAGVIQRAWRDAQAVRAAQQQLLCKALLALEQQLVRSNAAAARAEARAEARSQYLAAAAAVVAGTVPPAALAAAAVTAALGPGQLDASAPSDAAPTTTAAAAAAAAHPGSINLSGVSHTRHSAPPHPAVLARSGGARGGGPLVLPGDFFDAFDSDPAAPAAGVGEAGGGAGGAKATSPAAAAAAAAVPAAAAAGGFPAVTGGSRGRPQSALVRPRSASVAAATGSSSSYSRRPQSAMPRPVAAPAAVGSRDAPACVTHSSRSRPQSAAPASRPHPPAAHTATPHAPMAAAAAAARRSAAAAAAAVPTAAAAALPEGPMPLRGPQLTGQLTPLTQGPDSSGNLSVFAGPAVAAAAGGGQHSGCSGQQQQQQQWRVRPKSAGVAAAAAGASRVGSGSGGGVGWHEEGVVDLEIEAQLRQLVEVLPAGVRQQVAAQHLAQARQQLLLDRQQHDARVASHRFQRAAEAALHQTLTAVAGEHADVTSKVPPLPPRPHLRLIPSRQQLKELVAAAMDLQQQQQQQQQQVLLEAACADSDTLELQLLLPRSHSGSVCGLGSSSGGASSSGGGGGSRGGSLAGGRGLSGGGGGGRFNS